MEGAEEIRRLIEEGEGQNLEFKSSFNSGVIETLVAFANSGGGNVVIGLDDKRAATGLTMNAESGQNWVNEVKSKTQPSLVPDLKTYRLEKSQIAVLSVQEYPIKPVAFKGRSFKRVGNSNHLLSMQEAADMHLRTFNSSWDNYNTNGYSLETISFEKVDRFIQRVNKMREIAVSDDALTFLRKHELIQDNRPSNACFLAFTGTDAFQACVMAGRFADRITIKDSVSIQCDLFGQVDKIMEFIKKHINKEFIITGDPQHEERWQYPLNALREIVVNMIVHRNYQDTGDAIIKIFNDRIEFFNPGKLLDPLTPEKLVSGDYSSLIRNKKIASLFKEAGIIEQYGSGIQRIIESFRAYGLAMPVFENFQHGFRVIVYSIQTVSSGSGSVMEGGQKSDQKSGQKSGQKPGSGLVSKAQKPILELIRRNNQITRRELSDTLKISESTIQKHIDKLKAMKLLIRIGPDKGGHWEVTGE